MARIVAMEPSFWSWEKQIGEVEKTYWDAVAMEPSFWSWEKVQIDPGKYVGAKMSQWSPAFGAGKRFDYESETEMII